MLFSAVELAWELRTYEQFHHEALIDRETLTHGFRV